MGALQSVIPVGDFGHVSHDAAVEGGVDGRDQQPSARPQQRPGGPRHRLDPLHVHEGHVADDRVERALLAQAAQGRLVGGVRQPVLHVSAVGTGPVEHPLAEVGGDDRGPEPGHAPGELAVSAGDLQDALALLQPQHPLDGRLDERLLPGGPGLHVLVPEGRVSVPHRAYLVGAWLGIAHRLRRRFVMSRPWRPGRGSRPPR